MAIFKITTATRDNYKLVITFISPSKIHVGEHFLASKQNICSHASFALLPLRKPKEI